MTALVTSPGASASASATTKSPLPPGESQGEGRPLLTEHFTTFASAPNGIKKLRELILELAVRGKLVPQSPNDEPASELLSKLRAEKARLVRAGKARVGKGDFPIDEAECPFDLPSSWMWVRLSEVGQIVGGSTPRSDDASNWADDGIPWLTPADLYGLKEKLIGKGRRCLSEAGLRSCSAQLMPAGTVLFSSRAPIGYVAIAANELCTNQGFKSIVPYLSWLTNYIYWFLRRSAREIDATASGTTFKEISGAGMALVLTPLPPLEEQKRIVAKVDELMALCDQLEAQQVDAEAAHEKLVRELLATLTQSQSAADFQSNWQRLVTHFDPLFTTESSIDGLESAIRQLAIVGRLASQNANEEPADRLIARIAAQKERLVAEGKIREGKSRSELESGQGGGDLPFGWVRTTVGDVTICRDGERVPISRPERDGREKIYDYYGASGVIDKIDGFLFDKPLLLIGEDGANLINRSTPIAFIARGQYWVNNHAHVLDGISEDLLKYVELYFNAIDLKPYVTGTAQPKMNQAKMNGIPIALPPESEQKRIVSKVRDLMAICGQLRSQLIQARGLNQQLANALVEQVLV